LTLTPGARLDHYEIIAPIGSGGMGEVYQARDTKLGRDVAFKVLKDEFAGDPDRLSRFHQEARLLASLNHPNIAQIFGVVESDRMRAIVMELVEGETLQARLTRGRLPYDEFLSIAGQIAEALEAAHDHRIIHRDLKPGNIHLSADGQVKVLDFGLAKTIHTTSADPNLAKSRTVLAPTAANVLIGTPGYMSPEQLRGQASDERSDIWAFGCVLYEMLTGRQAFTGDTITDIISGIVRVDPDWDALTPVASLAVQAVIKRCLQKDRRRRFHSIADVRIELEEAQIEPAAPISAPRRHSRTAWGVAALFVITTIALLVRIFYFAPAVVQPHVSRFQIELPPDASVPPTTFAPYPLVSPDGRYIAFVAFSGGTLRLWLRPIDALTAQPIAGTEGVASTSPFWSPDSRFIGFIANGKLKKVAIAGGPPQTLCDVAAVRTANGGTWNQNDVIIFAHRDGLHRVAADGGTSTLIRAPDKSKNEAGYTLPSFLPDGRHFLYVAMNSDVARTEVRVGSLDSNDDKPLFFAISRVLYALPGHLLFVRDGTLMAQPFNVRTLSLNGDPLRVTERIQFDRNNNGVAAFSASANGTLVFRTVTGPVTTELTWIDRMGKKLGVVGDAGNFQRPRLSNDQNRVAVERVADDGVRDIWLIDLIRGTNSRFTFDPADETYPIFSADGTQIAFASNRNDELGIYVKSITGTGTEELVQKIQGQDPGPSDWSPDGKTLLYGFVTGATGIRNVWALPMTGERKAFAILSRKFSDQRAQFSPNGRWILYTSTETGRGEIYAETFPPSGRKWQVSTNGANYGHWRRDGKEIVFDSIDGKLMAVDVKLDANFDAGVPHQLFQIPGTIIGGRFTVSSDAQRFLFPLAAQSGDRPAITVVLNWPASIKN